MLLITAATAKELVAGFPCLSGQNLQEHRPLYVELPGLPGASGASGLSGASGTSGAPGTSGTSQNRALSAVLCITGVGPVNAAMALGAALQQFSRPPAHIRGVLNLGLAGSFDTALAPLGSTVLVQEEIWPEYGLTDPAGGQAVDAAALGFPLWRDQDRVVTDRLSLCSAPQELGLPPLPALPKGSALTVAGVSNSEERAHSLHARYGALLENMEGFAIALACARARIPLLELRTVSNVVGSRAPKDRDFGLAFASMSLFFTRYLWQKPSPYDRFTLGPNPAL